MWRFAAPRLAARRCRDRPFNGHGKCFATATFSCPGKREQTLFVVGLDSQKFFGQHGSEEGLKLLERVVTRDEAYDVLVGLSERDMTVIKRDFEVKDNKLTPTRELEKENHAEFIPIIQAAMMDKRSIIPISRLIEITQANIGGYLWSRPRECLNLYPALWRRRKVKHDAIKIRELWTQFTPAAAYAYYGEVPEIVSARAATHLSNRANDARGKLGVSVLVVDRGIFDPIVERLKLILDGKSAQDIASAEFARPLRERAEVLCREPGIDLCPLIAFIYAGLPFLAVFGLTGIIWNSLPGGDEAPRYERVGPPIVGYIIDRDRD